MGIEDARSDLTQHGTPSLKKAVETGPVEDPKQCNERKICRDHNAHSDIALLLVSNKKIVLFMPLFPPTCCCFIRVFGSIFEQVFLAGKP